MGCRQPDRRGRPPDPLTIRGVQFLPIKACQDFRQRKHVRQVLHDEVPGRNLQARRILGVAGEQRFEHFGLIEAGRVAEQQGRGSQQRLLDVQLAGLGKGRAGDRLFREPHRDQLRRPGLPFGCGTFRLFRQLHQDLLSGHASSMRRNFSSAKFFFENKRDSFTASKGAVAVTE